VKSKRQKDKLICHIIVMMMTIMDYRLDVKWLTNALKMEFKQLVPYLKMVS
jgi:hypothetical protein